MKGRKDAYHDKVAEIDGAPVLAESSKSLRTEVLSFTSWKDLIKISLVHKKQWKKPGNFYTLVFMTSTHTATPLNTAWKSPQGSYARWDTPFGRLCRNPGWPPRPSPSSGWSVSPRKVGGSYRSPWSKAVGEPSGVGEAVGWKSLRCTNLTREWHWPGGAR